MKMDKCKVVFLLFILICSIIPFFFLQYACDDQGCRDLRAVGYIIAGIFLGGSVVLLLLEGMKYCIDRRQRFS